MATRHYSLPFSPPCSPAASGPREPQRGDIVVFRLPKDDSIDYIKRVIGLPGDRIQMIDGVLYINGKPVQRERIDDFVETDGDGPTTRARRWRETLPNGVSYTTLDLVDNGLYANTQVYGAARSLFHDGRQSRQFGRQPRLSQVGYVPFENLIGRAQVIFFSVIEGEHAWEVWRWPWWCAGAGCSRWRAEAWSRFITGSRHAVEPAHPVTSKITPRTAAVDHERPGRETFQHPHQRPDRHERRDRCDQQPHREDRPALPHRGGPCAAPIFP